MKYEGDAVQYTAFALVAIESVWPNPDGNELSPDESDLDLIDATPTNYKSSARKGFSTLSSDVVTERDYYEKQGYYKILPLNVTAVRTSSSETGSSFSVTFTLDDLLLITAEDNLDSLRYATGLPFSTNDLIESDLQGALPQLFDAKAEGAEWRYVKDSELGLSRYRISGANSSFNVEDLVDINDTVTIWLYHDPQDFYLKDDLPQSNYFDDEGNLLRFTDKITNVIGSGDRRNQFSSDTISYDETLLGVLGIINEFSSTSIETLLASGEDAEEIVAQAPTANKDNLYNLISAYSLNAMSGSPATTIEERVVVSVAESFNDASETSIEKITNLILKFVNPTVEPTTTVLASTTGYDATVADGRRDIQSIIEKLPLDTSDSDFLLGLDSYISVLNHFENIGLHTTGEIQDFIYSINLFALEIDKKTKNYVTKYLTKKQISRTKQTFVNGRTSLLNESHGETPYIALKGVISSVEVSVGTSEGTYAVTLSGKGYEKTLTDNEVFYEDFFFNSDLSLARTDYQTVYVNMSPPRAIQHILSRWAAKQVVLGKANAWSQATINRFAHISMRLNKNEEEENEDNESLNYEEAAKSSPLGDNIPIRGGFILAESPDNLQLNQIRLFAPLNYLDTTRLQEMVRTLDRSYQYPEIESSFNTAMELEGRNSIMDNIRKIGGIANFYQLFVDETGRVRYRLTFEAMERTPKPGFTPTIQDYDLLSEGNVFSSDDNNLVTVVDVKPLTGEYTTVITDYGLIGRSTPEVGKVPLGDTGDIPVETLSPEMYRYGMRTFSVQDLYQSTTREAAKKAALYRQFFGIPLKKASVRLRNNTSYRVGETVLISLLNNKKRSRTLIDIPKMINWLKFILTNEDPSLREDLLKMYIGVDDRLLEKGKNSFILTSGEYNPFWGSEIGGSGINKYAEFNKNPHEYVAQMFLDTLTFVSEVLPGVNVITPDYFPTLYWFYQYNPGGATSWDENRVDDEAIKEAYKLSLMVALGNNDAKDKLAELMSDVTNIGLINSLRYQNFRATSYYIESVSHNFVYGADATTSLSLNYGQDNLVLQDPVNLLPIGFISLEKKMRIGYDNATQNSLWQDYEAKELSAIQKMYLNQFKEDDLFKRASFLHNSQYLRNASNYMYELGVVREGLDAYVTFDKTFTHETVTYEEGIKTTKLVSTPDESSQNIGLSENIEKKSELIRDAIMENGSAEDIEDLK